MLFTGRNIVKYDYSRYGYTRGSCQVRRADGRSIEHCRGKLAGDGAAIRQTCASCISGPAYVIIRS